MTLLIAIPVGVALRYDLSKPRVLSYVLGKTSYIMFTEVIHKAC